MNSQAIVCLEALLLSAKVTLAERLARARELRAELPQGKFRARDIDAMKREGPHWEPSNTKLVTMDKKVLRAFPKRSVALSAG